MALTVKNKLRLVDGAIKKPSEEHFEELQQWNRCNNLVKTWLLGSMSKEISGSVIHCKDARQMWLDLQERFSHVNIVQLFHIENKIHDCIQGNMTKEITFYIETQKTMKFLMGLNESYSTVRSNTLLLEPLPTVNKAYSLVLHHERQVEVSSGKSTAQPEVAVFAVKGAGRETKSEEGGLRCGKCNKTNHITKIFRAYLKCTFCGWKGHSYEYCRKRKAVAEIEPSHYLKKIANKSSKC
ncbi:uncharacterized protein [Pyrus communis]|uniref:uncharacterized protein n=1 Tax=Pyrus communis TaxID=23211 RepID=UPI0035C12641